MTPSGPPDLTTVSCFFVEWNATGSYPTGHRLWCADAGLVLSFVCVFSLWVGCRCAIVQIFQRTVCGLVFRKKGCRVLGAGSVPRGHRWVILLLPPPPCGHSPTIFQALRGLRGGRKVHILTCLTTRVLWTPAKKHVRPCWCGAQCPGR